MVEVGSNNVVAAWKLRRKKASENFLVWEKSVSIWNCHLIVVIVFCFEL